MSDVELHPLIKALSGATICDHLVQVDESGDVVRLTLVTADGAMVSVVPASVVTWVMESTT